MLIDTKTAIKLIENGEVIAIPTDTVYGLAAAANNPSAIKRIFTLKKRNNHKPLIILGADIGQLDPFIAEKPKGFDDLTAKWPGALTIVVPASSLYDYPTVGLRIPDNDEALKLLAATGPLMVTSANISGGDPAITPEAIKLAFGDDLPIVRSSKMPTGNPSTIIAWQEERWQKLR